VFRQRPLEVSTSDGHLISIARKCGLPKRVPIENGELPKDELPSEISQAQSDWIAFRAFLYDFCIVPTDCSLSSGYLADLEQATRRSGPGSRLANACSAISFAAGAKVLRRPHLARRADDIYQWLVTGMIQYLAESSRPVPKDLSSVALLLGLHQVTTLPSKTVDSGLTQFRWSYHAPRT
jgi:hypothetical protein